MDAGILNHELNFRNICDNLYEGMYVIDAARKIVYWNRRAEELTGYSREEVMGKSCRDNLITHIDDQGEQLCLGLCPAKVAIKQAKVHEAKLYLQHKDGHRVPIITRVSPFYDQNGKVAGAVELFSDNTEYINIESRMQELSRLSLADDLTGVGNRRYAENMLKTRFEDFARYGWSCGLAFIDIDDFKKINDTYGHEAGDQVLKVVSKTLLGNIRASDFLGRWGGEEFLVIFSNVFSPEQLFPLADKLRVLVEKSMISYHNQEINVTVSLGATLIRKNDDLETLIARADKLMYQSKSAGKNKVSLEQ